jgi:inner membrane protein
MDTVSHTLIGLTLSRLDSARELGPVAAVTLTASSLLPDIDVVSRAFGSTSYLRHHRGITHGLAVLPLEAAALSGLLVAAWPAARSAGFPTLFVLSLIAMVVHILFDILTPYGTKILLPFHHHPVTTDSMPVFEPFLLLFTSVALVLSHLHESAADALAIGTLGMWAVFFAFYGASKAKAEALLKAHAGKGVRESDTFPVPGMPLVWLCVVRRRDRYETFTVNVLTNRRAHHRVYEPHPFPPELERTRMGRVFRRFARHFLVERTAEGRRHQYVIRDLRFDFPYRRKFFKWEITTDGKGRVIREKFRL